MICILCGNFGAETQEKIYHKKSWGVHIREEWRHFDCATYLSGATGIERKLLETEKALDKEPLSV